ncbi:Rieske domain-containing protein [Mangrovimicrobium sediminis]|uniref:Rieske domain-containing protein n=1 Tax=Mangrovimicrobium sediminis TaxID=2562682 RepID=A0A4Z0M275_9GAMM|nr:Rieske 2Fe-2S domain-containing protein [Haliea sp. SAOS-164]TGD73546.1 Rieske domain-containing protein [Haliea sp. SAOS-164]
MLSTDSDKSGLVYICERTELAEGDSRRVEVLFRQQPDSVIVLRHLGEVRAYRNLCVHMPRTLDCEHGRVFDRRSGHLRCSMHGIAYCAETGESLSEICLGKQLTAVRVFETDSGIYFRDRRIRKPAVTQAGE